MNASERIYEAIKGTHLPVVVSFGNTATSGGYFVAASADRIFTSKNTMTGSIGVIAVREDHTKKAAKDGISVEHIKTGDLAGLHDKFHPLTSNMNRVFRCRVERGYETFKERVAMGRKMTSGQVEAVAKGRVWTGAQAVRNGLCDEIGGLNDAIDFAQLTYCSGAASVVPFPKEDTVWEKLSLFLSARGDAEPKGSDSSSAMLFFMHDEEAAISCLLERNLDELKP